MADHSSIPVVLFAYARPDHLRQTLDCLRENRVPLVYAFSDGPRTPDKVPAVAQVREMLRAIDWCEVVLCERETNLGLGRSILTGVTEVLSKHEAAIIFEDDLICVPGTYDYLCSAMDHYRNHAEVMSVTGWTHPLVIPSDANNQPYFDGRTECWVWGTWARAWRGMDQDAKTLIQRCETLGIDVFRYGADLPAMAEVEREKNIWWVRFMYWHLCNHGLCMRPPWSMVEHIGFDAQATNAGDAGPWANPPLQPCPPLPTEWPEPLEHPVCVALWQKAYGGRPTVDGAPPATMFRRIKRALRKTAVRLTGSKTLETMTPKEFVRLLTPPVLIRLARRSRNDRCANARSHGLSGDYHAWDEALAASTGYDSEVILEKTRAALLRVKNGEAAYERDSVLFYEIQYSWSLLAGLMWAACRCGGNLNVLDFGGSLGSTYFQNREFLSVLPGTRWNVVEQSHQVETGKADFEDARLRFYECISHCLADTQPNVALLSSVLQYLEHPYSVLDEILRISCVRTIIVDRTPFWSGPTDRLCVQTVPTEIYPASYPSWIFSMPRFSARLGSEWKTVAEFDNPDRLPGPIEFGYRGMILARLER